MSTVAFTLQIDVDIVMSVIIKHKMGLTCQSTTKIYCSSAVVYYVAESVVKVQELNLSVGPCALESMRAIYGCNLSLIHI